MSSEKGSLSINSENILPIIKKWLYSDTDIFVRELVSNGADAITKLKKLVEMGEINHISTDEHYEINVTLDRDNNTIVFEDNGIGMTADEIKKYINEIAFSGANDFVAKYEEKIGEDNKIIGHFGLGFYSAFMVADKVQIDSLSHVEGSTPARWICEGGTEFEITESDKTTRGSRITLYLTEEGKEFLQEYKFKSILDKYCSFIPVEIYFESLKTAEEIKKEEEKRNEKIAEDALKTDDVISEDEIQEEKPRTPINDIHPLWTKNPSECTDEEYKAFYHKVFNDFADPLFWIHLNMDYPFRLQGILYFPKLKHELESIEGQVKLYNNQVYIADNIKEVIPEFLLLLKGVMDCPDLPLNVSRSFLQNDGYVAKMSGYISKKVADKLNSLNKKDRELYNNFWDDISPFIKYGCIKEQNFYDKVKDSILYKTTKDDYVTLKEFTDRNEAKTGKTVFYVSNLQQQTQYVKMFKENEMEAVLLTTNLDNPFISYLESYEKDIKFNRIDSDISSSLKDEKVETDESKLIDESLEKVFKEKLNMENIKVKTENLKSSQVSAVILLSEQARRMQEMSKMFGNGAMGLQSDMFKSDETLVLNNNNSLVKRLIELKDDETRKEDVTLMCEQIYDLAMMSHKQLEAEAMAKFIDRSNRILERITK